MLTLTMRARTSWISGRVKRCVRIEQRCMLWTRAVSHVRADGRFTLVVMAVWERL